MITLKIIKDLQSKQQELDKFIIEENKIDDVGSSSFLIRIKIALLTEIGELANEIKTFKHWKKDKTIDLTKAREELIDCLHFYLSWTNIFQIDFSDYKFKKSSLESDYNELLTSFFSETELFNINKNNLEEENYKNSFLKKIDEEKCKSNFYRWLIIFEELAQKLGMNEKDIESWYLKKNQINRVRQKSNY
ncbi:MAG: hypothetical protein mread185_000289 [Mycoplasmataceae bacterium]|nr:MAG: hypothetical protein mread185_000289 [Mycoplasmataceae bacterium]